jgi:hemerythrin-like domain-containing protein
MVRRIAEELARIKQTGAVDLLFVSQAVDFIRTYADRCHHGKEENILFRELDKKNLTPEQRQMMEELVEEHILGRTKTAEVVAAKERYACGDHEALGELVDAMAALVEFYPKHIAKEDKSFFLPAMALFTPAEKEQMLQEGFDFDAGLIHEKYRQLVSELEQS